MTETYCPICDSTKIRRVALEQQPSYDACENCGHYFLEVDDDQSDQAYSEAQDRYYSENSVLLEKKESMFESELLNERYRAFKKFLPDNSDVLEVGPGGGHVLRWLAAHGHRTTGVEYSSFLARRLELDLNAPIITAEFETYDFGDHRFDAVCSFHVIEHVPNPHLQLIRAFEIVKPGGLAFIATPNAESWEQKFVPQFGPNFDAAHLHIFSRASLSAACQKAGWEVISERTPESSAGWARVFSRLLRTVRAEDPSLTAGKYALSTSFPIVVLSRIFQFLSVPARLLQQGMGNGNEIFVVLRKPEN